ncbi:Cyclin-T2 [Halotydeus destructor]|nr:Cyclin-T2 [Halotydeus destructor]
MAGSDRWYFSKEVLENTPSRKCGMDAEKELSYRQQTANLIQDMGQRLQVTQLCINTAIVYMHRFYMFHSFNKYSRHNIGCCALFLAAKVEEQPRKLEHVIRVHNLLINRGQTQNVPQPDVKSPEYIAQAKQLVENENRMLQSLGFDIAIEHPHTFVVKCCQLVRASKDLAQTSYFMATNSLHLTTMCLQYKPTVVACVCIHLACKWSSWTIPKSREDKEWFYYIDKTVTNEMLEELTSEFLAILDNCPSRLRQKIMGATSSDTSFSSPSLDKTKRHDEGDLSGARKALDHCSGKSIPKQKLVGATSSLDISFPSPSVDKQRRHDESETSSNARKVLDNNLVRPNQKTIGAASSSDTGYRSPSLERRRHGDGETYDVRKALDNSSGRPKQNVVSATSSRDDPHSSPPMERRRHDDSDSSDARKNMENGTSRPSKQKRVAATSSRENPFPSPSSEKKRRNDDSDSSGVHKVKLREEGGAIKMKIFTKELRAKHL